MMWKHIILEKEVFLRSEIEKRMTDGGFNSLSKFELFILGFGDVHAITKKIR